jgi:hypothetical protein
MSRYEFNVHVSVDPYAPDSVVNVLINTTHRVNLSPYARGAYVVKTSSAHREPFCDFKLEKTNLATSAQRGFCSPTEMLHHNVQIYT